MRTTAILALLLSFAAGAPQARAGARIKELVTLEGVRDNQLIGYGLVVGLNKTGDRLQTVFSAQSLTNMLQRMGVSVPPDGIRVNNTAAVMVTATLPPFAQTGSKIDLTVAAIGDASSLRGGILLLTPLRSAEGQVYVVGQGPVVTGAFTAAQAGSSQTINHPTVGRVVNGGIVELQAPSVSPSKLLRLQLRSPDFTTAARISEVINERFVGGGVANAENSAVVVVRMPDEFEGSATSFVSEIERLEVDPDQTASVVINERTGTIVLGRNVRIAPVSIFHGDLAVEVSTEFNVSQPEPFSRGGQTVVTPETTLGVFEEEARSLTLKEGATVDELVKALMSIGSTPRDIISILQNIRAAGALEAEIKVI